MEVNVDGFLISNRVAGFEVFNAVSMNNVFFWDERNQFVPHKRHITSPLQNPAN
jgi:hypothetical protein